MDRLFRITPAKVKAKDGSNEIIPIEHRLGRDAGYFTRRHLMDKLGLEQDYADYVTDMQKKIRDQQRLKEICAGMHKVLKSKMNRVVSEYRRYLETFYGNYPRPLLPMFAFVPVNDKEDGLFFQGLLDEASYKLVLGDPADDVAWCEITFSQTKKFADLNKRAENTAKALVSHPGLNKDLRYRIAAIAQGKLPEKLTYNGSEEKK